MYTKEAITLDDLLLHRTMSKKGWDENEWVYEEYQRDDIRSFFVLDDEERPIGTFSLMIYDPNQQGSIDIPDVYSFRDSNLPYQEKTVYELDKLMLLKEHRSKENLFRLALSVFDACEIVGATHVLASTKPRLVELMKKVIRIPLDKVSDPFYCEQDKCELVAFQATVRKVVKRRKLIEPLFKRLLKTT